MTDKFVDRFWVFADIILTITVVICYILAVIFLIQGGLL